MFSIKYYTLKPQYALRGYKDIKYCLLDMKNMSDTDKFLPLSETQFNALELLTAGGISPEDNLIPGLYRRLFDAALEKGFIEECDKTHKLSDYQKFHATKAHAVHTLLWSVTGNCNLNCRHCYVHGGTNPYGEPTVEQCRETVRQMNDANINMVAITGGEPLVRRDLWDIVDIILENHIEIMQFFTNGMALNERFIDEMESRGIVPNWFMMSFDGVGYHDDMRGVKGAEQRAVEAMKLVKKRGYEITASMAVHLGNASVLEETYELLKNIGVTKIKFSPVMAVGNWINQPDKNIDPFYIYDRFLDLLRLYKKDGMPITVSMSGFFNRKKDSVYSPFTDGCGNEDRCNDTLCEPVRRFPYLLPNGKLLPCITMSGTEIEKLAPSIYDEEQSIEKILTDSPINTYMDYTYSKLFAENRECAACENRFRCSGCRGYALANGGYFAKDPYACAFFKGGYEQKIKDIFE